MGEIICSINEKPCWEQRVLDNCLMENQDGINDYTCSWGEYKIKILDLAALDVIDNEWIDLKSLDKFFEILKDFLLDG